MKLFSGSANTSLSTKVSELLSVPLSKSTLTTFGNSEIKVRIEEPVKGETCIVIQPTSNPTNNSIIELCFYCDALKREEAEKVIGIIPYFGYAKQNLQHVPGECVSANVIVNFLQTIGFDKVYAFDLHDEATAGVFEIPFRNLSAFPYLATQIAQEFKTQGINLSDVVLLSPDQGAVEKVRHFGKAFFGTEDFHEASIEKQRNQYVTDETKPMELYGNVEGKIVLIVDDMVVSGGTIINAADLCLEKGATAVYSAAIHHDFTIDAPKKLQDSHIKKFYTTDSIALRTDQAFEKLQEFTLAGLIAEEIRKES